ncbi:MAG: hypothetical protein KW804_02435 [Candidatus Doudnabacteria bacterium]|nr:hypothetical protein [Candidatus Doudnabacteria bacterium]
MIKVVRRSDQSFSLKFELALAQFARSFGVYADKSLPDTWQMVISLSQQPGFVSIHYHDHPESEFEFELELVSIDRFDPDLELQLFKEQHKPPKISKRAR